MSNVYLGDKPTKTTELVNADEVPILDSQDLTSGRKKVKKVTFENLKESVLAGQPKVLLLMLQQGGTEAPIATIVKDEIGIGFEWVYGGAGDYQLNFDSNLSDSFSKIAVYVTLDNRGFAIVAKNELNQLVMQTFIQGGQQDDVGMISTTFKIEVYP